MKPNYNSVFKKFSYKLFQFAKMKKILNIETRVLVYKQAVLPLTEYVSFIMCLNNMQDVDKLQKLQNRALRMCYNIQNPRDISVKRLHEMSCIDMLDKRRMAQLLVILYENRFKYLRQVDRPQNTRQAIKSNFEIKRVNIELYSKSPYCIGGKFWNNLPKQTQDLETKEKFKRAVLELL